MRKGRELLASLTREVLDLAAEMRDAGMLDEMEHRNLTTALLDRSLPRLAAVSAVGPQTLLVQWQDGRETRVDLSGMIATFKVYAPLRQSELFARVVLGEHGTDVIWPGDIDMAADTLARLSQEQAHP